MGSCRARSVYLTTLLLSRLSPLLGLTTCQPCGSLCHLREKWRSEIEEIVEEMKKKDRGEKENELK